MDWLRFITTKLVFKVDRNTNTLDTVFRVKLHAVQTFPELQFNMCVEEVHSSIMKLILLL